MCIITDLAYWRLKLILNASIHSEKKKKKEENLSQYLICL